MAWSATETFRNEPYRESTDIYSLGVVIWELMSLDIPWKDMTAPQIIGAVGYGNQRLPIPQGIAAPLQQLLRNCFDNSDRRPTAEAMREPVHQLWASQKAEEDRKAYRTGGVPESFLCPISMEVMRNPVICSDGHTYEKAVVEDWLTRSDRSPMTNEKLANMTLIPNHALRATIEGFL